jgi:hypothetical protein
MQHDCIYPSPLYFLYFFFRYIPDVSQKRPKHVVRSIIHNHIAHETVVCRNPHVQIYVNDTP